MRTFNTIGRHLLVAAFIGLLFGCAEQAPKAEAPTEAVVAVSEAAEAPAAAPNKAPGGQPGIHPTIGGTGGRPTGGMPNDAIHAGLPRGHQGARSGSAGLPQGHPPLPGHPTMGQRRPRRPMASPAAPTPMEEGVELPLPLKGPGSSAELTARLKRLPQGDDGADVRKRIEEAFRLTFTGDRARRDVKKAAELLSPIAKKPEAAATSERILGYVAVSSGFDVPRAFKHYGKAVELEPDYGEAHYALAFMHAMKDRTSGKKHYDRALGLGVPDTRGLSRFYGEAGKPAPPAGH